MNTFIARKSTTLKAIAACQNREDEKGRIHPDKRSIEILEGVLATRKPNLAIIAKWTV